MDAVKLMAVLADYKQKKQSAAEAAIRLNKLGCSSEEVKTLLNNYKPA